MKSKKMPIVSRVLLLVSAVLLAVSLFFPWWGLYLIAPQYPEGLDLVVYPSKLDGEIDIINNLNHYIGMAEITEAGFPELKFIPIVVWGIVAIIALSGILGRKKLAILACVLVLIGGALGVYDMYYWLHEFGTNLSPDAPIKLDPYVPPIVGENQLANFTTYSSFRKGFYFLILAVLALLLGTFGDKLWEKES